MVKMGNSLNSQNTQKGSITLIQMKPVLSEEGRSMFFSGDLVNNGELCGFLTGKAEKMINKDETENIKVRDLYFDFEDGQIFSTGLSKVYNSDSRLEETHETSITGGTGRFRNVKGYVETTQIKETDRYLHVIYLQ